MLPPPLYVRAHNRRAFLFFSEKLKKQEQEILAPLFFYGIVRKRTCFFAFFEVFKNEFAHWPNPNKIEAYVQLYPWDHPVRIRILAILLMIKLHIYNRETKDVS